MESIYGPPQDRKTSRPEPRWHRAIRALLLVIVGSAAFVLLIWLEVSTGSSDPDDPLRRLERVQFNLPRYEPILLDIPAFKPLQSAEIIPSSAIHPAGPETSPAPRRLQTAEIILR